MRIALVKNGVVSNIIEATPEQMGAELSSLDFDSWETVDDWFTNTGYMIAVGDLYDGLEYTKPVVEEPEPTPEEPQTVFTKLEFLLLFTVDERVAIDAATATNPYVKDFMNLLNMAQEIDVNHASTIEGIGFMALPEVGLLTSARAAEICPALGA